MIDALRSLNGWEAGAFFLLANALIFGASVAGCVALGRLFGHRRIFDRWEPLRPVELAAALGAVVLNALVSLGGWAIWRADGITLQSGGPLRALADCLVMILAMDFGMYVFHRAAHARWIFPLVHRFHHRHEATNPVSLFVLHPLEVLGFGALMIGFLIVFPMSPAGLVGYLSLNLAFGTLGHSGVEPFPRRWRRLAALGLLGTSSFHAGHHQRLGYNFGFYTVIWDRLFGTLDPEYPRRHES